MCLCVVCHTVNTFCCLWCLESVTAWQFVVNYLLWLHVVQHCLWFMAAGVFKAMQIFSCLDQDCLFSVSFKILCTLKSRFCPFVQVMSILFQIMIMVYMILMDVFTILLCFIPLLILIIPLRLLLVLLLSPPPTPPPTMMNTLKFQVAANPVKVN